MGHREDAIPTGWGFVEKIFLTALPVGACRAIIGPLVENGLEGGLSLEPAAVLKECASFVKTIEAGLRVGGKIGRGRNQFVDDDRLQLALHADEIKCAENEAGVFRCKVGGFVDQNMSAVILVQTFEPRSKIHGI